MIQNLIYKRIYGIKCGISILESLCLITVGKHARYVEKNSYFLYVM